MNDKSSCCCSPPARRGRTARHQVILLFQEPLIIDQDEKERLVLFDRPAQTSTELVTVLIALRSARQILKIGQSCELRIVIRVKQSAVVVVASGASSHLYLCGASSKRGIDVVGGCADFLHHGVGRVRRPGRSV